MTFLVPLGLLGLLGIVALIIIYIIRPNYQQKYISTTFVWKLSLKYRKKKIPVSKLRNFLLILCQILILTACALILAQPHKILKAQVEGAEVILIIDSSASMRAGDEETRFERAVAKASEFADEILSDGGIVSVIVADDKPEFYQPRLTEENKALLTASFDYLLENDTCSYGSSDLNAAIALCEEVILENPKAQIYLYTDAQYSYVPKMVNIVDVTYSDEWNAAILDAYAESEDNIYAFVFDVDVYCKDMLLAKELEVVLDIQGANAETSDDEGENFSFTWSVSCSDGLTQKVIFISDQVYSEDPERYDSIYGSNICVLDDADRIFSYKSVHVSLTEEDSYAQDDVFDIYGGQKETIRIQYASEKPNSFWTGVLGVLANNYSDRWDIVVNEVKKGDDPVLEGFDLYIFEHKMPAVMPTDGVVFLFNPDSTPTGAGFRITKEVQYRNTMVSFTEEVEHELLKGIVADNVEVSRYLRCTFDGAYEALWACDGYPMLAVKDEIDSKVVVMPFSLHYSNLAVIREFPMLVGNLFNYFFPTTVDSSAYDVYETVTLNTRGTELVITGANDLEVTFEEFPATFALSLPGTYTLTQTPFASNEPITEQIYVRVSAEESNIWTQYDALDEPYTVNEDDDFFEDLLIYVAAALVFLLFAEWWLKSRDAA